MFEIVVEKEAAEKEVTAWLDRKKIFPKRRTMLAAQIDTLIEAVQYGIISIEESGKITHPLQFPVADQNGNQILAQLTYKDRITQLSVDTKIRETRNPGPDTRLEAYMHCLTDQPMAMFGKLDAVDLGIAQSIAVFFMP